jgi:uncharacterized protein YutE (UPF0331/DUF86 family)
MVDPEVIEGLFRNLDRYLESLRQLALSPSKELAEDPIRLGAAKYYLQVSIECCIDIANHIIARQRLRAPETYADSFAVLVEQQIIDPEFLPTAQKMVRMRNRLVHLYWEVDAYILHDTLQHNLGDFDRFKAYVLGFLRPQV